MDKISISSDLEDAIFDINSLVRVKVEIDFKNDFTWVIIPQAYIVDVSYNEKMEGQTGFAIANTCSITLNNKERWFSDLKFGTYDDDFTSGSTNLNGTVQADGFGYLRPRRRVRLSITVGAGNEWVPKFYGFVDDSGWKEVIKEANNNIVRINCVDTAKIMLDEPLVDETGRYDCYIDKKLSDPDDTVNSLVHLIASKVNLHHWISSVVVTGGTTCTVASTTGLQPGMIMTGIGISGTIKIDSITNSTVFEIDTAVTNTTYTDWEASMVEAEKISIVYPYAPLLESAWTELALMAEAMHGYCTFNNEGILVFGESRYQDIWSEPTSPQDTLDNDFFNGIDKSPLFTERLNVIGIEWDKYDKVDSQNIYAFGENYNAETGLCNHTIAGYVSGTAQAGSDEDEVLLEAGDIQGTDYYNGWEIEVDSEIREVLSYSGVTNKCIVRAFTSSTNGKAYLLTTPSDICSKINEFQALYDIASKNVETNEIEAGFAVVYADNIDVTPTVKYVHNSIIYDAFDAGMLSLETFDTTSFPDRAVIKLKNNSTMQINLLKLTFKGEPTINNKRFTYAEVDTTTANKENPNYIGRHEEITNNKYFTDQILYSAKQYQDWVAYKLDKFKDPRRIYSLQTVRPVIHYRPGILLQVEDTLSGTGIDKLCRLLEIKSDIKAGKMKVSLTLREAYTGHSRTAEGQIISTSVTGSGHTAQQSEITGSQFVSFENDFGGYINAETGATTVPSIPTIIVCQPVGIKAIALAVDRQLNLLNAFDSYEWQVSDDQVDWYELRFDGVDWKGTISINTSKVEEYFVHSGIPNSGSIDNPIGRTLYYRVRRKTKDSSTSAYSSIQNATTKTVDAGDIAANSVYVNNLVAGIVSAMMAQINNYLEVGGDGFIGKTYGNTNGYQECGLSGKDATLESGLAQSTAYYFKVTVDAGSIVEYIITTSTDTTFEAIISLMNIQTQGASWSITGGDLRCVSALVGEGSAVALSNSGLTGTSLFSTLTGFSAFDTAVDGMTSAINWSNTRCRVYESSVVLEMWDGTEWIVLMKIGGFENGEFLPYYQGKGLIALGASDQIDALDYGDKIPTSGTPRLFKFDNSYEDHNGSDIWDTKSNIGFSTVDRKFGTYCIEGTTDEGALVDSDTLVPAFNITGFSYAMYIRLNEVASKDREVLKVEKVPVSGNPIHYNTTVDIDTDSYNPICCKVSENKLVSVFVDVTTGKKLYAKVGDISATGVITWGADQEAYDGTKYSGTSSIIALSETKVAIGFWIYETATTLPRQWVIIGSISGTTITFGTAVQMQSSFDDQVIHLCRINDSSFIALYPSDTTTITLQACDVSVTTITVGDTDTIATVGYLGRKTMGLIPLTEDTFICFYYEEAPTSLMYAVVIGYSSSVLSIGTGYSIGEPSPGNYEYTGMRLTDDSFAIGYKQQNYNLAIIRGSISGTVISFNSKQTLTDGDAESASFNVLGRETVLTKIVCAFEDHTDTDGKLLTFDLSDSGVVSNEETASGVWDSTNDAEDITVIGLNRLFAVIIWQEGIARESRSRLAAIDGYEGMSFMYRENPYTRLPEIRFWFYFTDSGSSQFISISDTVSISFISGWIHISLHYDNSTDNIYATINLSGITIDVSTYTLGTNVMSFKFLPATDDRIDDLIVLEDTYSNLTYTEAITHFKKNVRWSNYLDSEKDVVIIPKSGGKVYIGGTTEGNVYAVYAP